MRLKEDSSSWRSGAIKKRDFKHDQSEPVIKFYSHKNRNKWCRGKVGIKHSVVWQHEKDFFGNTYKMGTCQLCKKRMFARS